MTSSSGEEQIPLRQFTDSQGENRRREGNRDEKMKDFVHSKFKLRECSVFVPTDTSQNMCGCGRAWEWHEKKNIPNTSEQVAVWDVKTCTTTDETNAFGKCEMLGYSGCGTMRKLKFLRLDATDTEKDRMESLHHFMKEFWRMETPKLIISINGGSKKMEKCDDELHAVIKRGLYKITTSIKTWIVTGGIYDGVSRLIGQAVHDRPVDARMEKNDFIVIGITSWGTVYNNSKLINQQTRGVTDLNHRYFNESRCAGKGQVILDPNHTHLLLVDDGTEKKYGGEVKFRTDFEAFRTDEHRLIKETETVKLQLLIEGGHAALPILKSDLDNDSAIIIVKHSGRCADLLCNMLQRTATIDCSNEEEIERIFEEELPRNISKWTNRDDVKKKCLKVILKVVKKRDNIYIFDYHDEKNMELDKFILQVIFRRCSQLKIDDKMRLALTMKRCDLAREEVLIYDSNPQEMDMKIIMKEALQNNASEFVDLLLSEGLVIEEYLKPDKLMEMYCKGFLKNDSVNNFLFRILEKKAGFRENCKETPMPAVGRLIRYLTREIVVQLYKDKDFPNPNRNSENQSHRVSFSEVNDPTSQISLFQTFPPRDENNERIFTAFDLFLWAILHNRIELAKTFWRVGKDQVSVALVGSFILNRLGVLAASEVQVSLARQYKENSQIFEALAVELLQIAYEYGEKRTHILLCRRLPYCGGNSCLFLAYQFGCMAFLHHEASQTRLSRIWMGAIPSSVSKKWFLENIFLFPFAIRHVFPEEPSPNEEKNKEQKQKEKHWVKLEENPKGQSYWQALNLFHVAPITKFSYYVMSYCVFLFILTHFVLIDLEPVKSISQITVCEVFTWIYCFDIIAEEIRQIMDMPQSNLKSKIRYWIRGTGSVWNKYDFGAICLFLVSVFLRFALPASWFALVRVSFGLMIAVFYLRFLQYYLLHQTIGPKVFIINKMLKDLVFFVYIFVVFLFAYGSFIQATVYPNKEFSFATLQDIVRFPFWQVFGELNLEYYQGNMTCDAGTHGCGVQSSLVELAGGVYILSVNILLINLLIAIFGNTFNTVHQKSEKVWAFFRFGLIQEFQERAILPPPFLTVALILRYVVKRNTTLLGKGDASSKPFNFKLEPCVDNKIAKFENNCVHIYLAKREDDTVNALHNRMRMIQWQLRQRHEARLVPDPKQNGIQCTSQELLEPRETGPAPTSSRRINHPESMAC